MKKIERICIDWNDIDSIKRSERRKKKLENNNYKLVNTNGSINYSILTYEVGI